MSGMRWRSGCQIRLSDIATIVVVPIASLNLFNIKYNKVLIRHEAKSSAKVILFFEITKSEEVDKNATFT